MKKTMKNLIGLLILSSGMHVSGESIYNHKAEVFGTWTIEDSPIFIHGEVIVPPNHELIIEPGVEIFFKTGDGLNLKENKIGVLRVLGTLIAEGYENSLIRFSRQGSSGKWGAIVLENKSQPSVFRFCEIEHSQHVSNVAGMYNYRGAISLKDNVYALIRNNSIHDNDVGIQVARTDAKSIPFIYMNYFYQNEYAGILCYQTAHLIIEKNVIENSKTGVFCLQYSNPQIRNNIFNNVNEGIMSYFYSTPRIENNRIQANNHGVLAMYKSTVFIYNTVIQGANFGITLDGMSELLFENSILSDIHLAGMNLDNQSSVFVHNSILWETPLTASFFDLKSKITFQYSLIEKEIHSEQAEFLKGNLIGNNPLFQDSQNGNFHLNCDVFHSDKHSPCIDKGNPEYPYNDKMINWNAGWWSSKNDLGIFGGSRNSHWNLPIIINNQIVTEQTIVKNELQNSINNHTSIE